MAFEVVKRNRYQHPPTGYFPHASEHHYQDQEEFHRPLTRLDSAHLRGDWGIADGLEVSGAPGATAVVIAAGAAVDKPGETIVLPATGRGFIGTNPPGALDVSDPTVPTVPVSLPLGTHSGQTVYVTIKFLELSRSNEGSGGRFEQVPWLRLQPTTGPPSSGAYVNDGSSVILAIVDVSGTGTLSGLRYQDGALPFGRRLLGRRTGPVRLKRRQKAGDTLGETPAGTIDALEGGGLRLSVPNTGDAVRLEQEGGGSFSNLDLHANDIVARNAAGQTAVEIDTTTARVTVGAVGVAGELHVKDGQGRETVLIDGANGNVVAGTQGVEGDILVRDASDRLVITLDGDDAAVVVGAQGNEGDLLVKDATGTNTIRLDGATGDVEFKGRLLDSAGSHGGIGHTSLQRLPELIGGGITALHRHTNSGNATRAVALPLNNNANMSETVLTITLPSRQRVFAFIAITSLVYQGALHPPGLAFAGIARVDGQPMPFPWPGYLLNSPVYSGLAQSIEFKLSSPYSFVESWAVAVVMPEG